MKRHSVTYRGRFIGNRQLDCGRITKKARSADWGDHGNGFVNLLKTTCTSPIHLCMMNLKRKYYII